MSNYYLYDAFVVHPCDTGNQEARLAANDYFKIVFIEKGVGNYTLNGAKISYQTGDMLLFTNRDSYAFETKKQFKINFFSFSELLVSNKTNLSGQKYWVKKIEQILDHPKITVGDIISIREDRKIIWDLYHLVLEEFKNERKYHQEIIFNAISTILSIIIRNISKNQKQPLDSFSTNDTKINLIINHIHQNVYNSEFTKINFISKKFEMSQSSLSTVFKKTTGDSVHQYITKVKMKLAEQRLQDTEFTVAQIANQLGYTDESHLTKTFKKYFSMSPKQYREELMVNV